MLEQDSEADRTSILRRSANSAKTFGGSRDAIGPTDPLALTLGPPDMQNGPAARLQQGHMFLVQIRQPVGPDPNILEEASETGDTNCDVTAVESHGRACIAGSL